MITPLQTLERLQEWVRQTQSAGVFWNAFVTKGRETPICDYGSPEPAQVSLKPILPRGSAWSRMNTSGWSGPGNPFL